MRIRRLLAVGAAGAAAALGITTAASAVTGSGIAAAPDSLRALAAKTGRDVSITIFTASSLNSGEKLFFGRGKLLSPFQTSIGANNAPPSQG